MRVEYHRHNLGERELQAFARVLGGTMLTVGAEVGEFERRFSLLFPYDGAETVGVSAGTHALHLALRALGIGPGDEVITTPMTFLATVEAIFYVGARPVLVDVESSTGNIDAGRIERAITQFTKAILPVHLYGHMADMRAIRSVADHFNLRVIEDSAHCVEGKRDGVRPGELGDVACFSFQALKVLTSGEGGALVTRNKDIAAMLRRLRNHGLTRGAQEQREGYAHADAFELGYKYSMTNMSAALLLPQLDLLEERLLRRLEIARVYREAFEQVSGIELPSIHPGTESARNMFTIWVNPRARDLVLRDVLDKGVGVNVQYRPIHAHTFYGRQLRYAPGSFPNAERIGDSTIALPFYTQLTNEEISYVIDTVTGAVTRH